MNCSVCLFAQNNQHDQRQTNWLLIKVLVWECVNSVCFGWGGTGGGGAWGVFLVQNILESDLAANLDKQGNLRIPNSRTHLLLRPYLNYQAVSLMSCTCTSTSKELHWLAARVNYLQTSYGGFLLQCHASFTSHWYRFNKQAFSLITHVQVHVHIFTPVCIMCTYLYLQLNGTIHLQHACPNEIPWCLFPFSTLMA